MGFLLEEERVELDHELHELHDLLLRGPCLVAPIDVQDLLDGLLHKVDKPILPMNVYSRGVRIHRRVPHGEGDVDAAQQDIELVHGLADHDRVLHDVLLVLRKLVILALQLPRHSASPPPAAKKGDEYDQQVDARHRGDDVVDHRPQTAIRLRHRDERLHLRDARDAPAPDLPRQRHDCAGSLARRKENVDDHNVGSLEVDPIRSIDHFPSAVDCRHRKHVQKLWVHT
mmetsp:Transcript_2566/g.7728  ORF Transcript_2566/g.7728 Transcript_2566/m.7728 type:complete len:228 (+) Transcript_2566:1509-2192(+)